MGYNAYIVKCQYSSPGIKTFTLTGMILRSKEAKKFTKAQVEKKARERFTSVLQYMVSDPGCPKTVEDFKMKITIKGLEYTFIDHE